MPVNQKKLSHKIEKLKAMELKHRDAWNETRSLLDSLRSIQVKKQQKDKELIEVKPIDRGTKKDMTVSRMQEIYDSAISKTNKIIDEHDV